MKRTSRGVLCVASMAACAGAIAKICYQPTWFNTTQVCETCALYSNCPGRVLCTATGGNGNPDPVVWALVACETFSGGTGTCGSGTGCVGGVRVMPPVDHVTIPRQICPPPCLDIQIPD